MDPGSAGLAPTGTDPEKAKLGLDFRWSLNTSRDQVRWALALFKHSLN